MTKEVRQADKLVRWLKIIGVIGVIGFLAIGGLRLLSGLIEKLPALL